ncbi:MAG: amidohydrolase family protein [Propionibacteriaceae bacterium]|jgi:imidazolonepropionase-like amidohydrolase|nr:amidohydrolase family protein [Propionibacteriaceae bacterium]
MSITIVSNTRPLGSRDTVDILIEDGKIAKVGRKLAFGKPALTVDAAGGTVLPGLIDAHFHAYGISTDMDEIEFSPLSYVALKAQDRLGKALKRGFTTVRDVAGGDPGLDRAIKEGLFPSPRYLYTGPGLSQTGGHGDGRQPHLDIPLPCGCSCKVVDGADAIRREVRDLFRRGAHAIKLMTSGGVVSHTDPLRVPQYTPEEIQAAVFEAERRGSYVAAHSYSPESIQLSVANGVRSIEHGNLLDKPTAKAMAAAGAILDPTLAAYYGLDMRGEQMGLTEFQLAKNAEVLSGGQEAIRIARAAGIPIGFGTDLMGDLEEFQLQGLRLQCEVEGLEQTVESATEVNAMLLKRDDLGKIAPGCVGDLVIFPGASLNANPELLWEGERIVMQAGAVV